jgi:chloramphenicol-sensitive protein RarD
MKPMDSRMDAAPGAGGGDTARGFALALSAYLLWGALPLYFAALSQVPTTEVIAHRVIWSVPVALAVLGWLGRTAELRAALRQPRTLAMAGVTSALIAANWGVYVWAVQTGQTLEAALGYYINPLFSILLGRVLLGERLARRQWAAVALATAAVAVLTWEAGRLPVWGLALTLTWGLYAYFKRALPIGPNQGFALEVILLTPPALAFLIWQGGGVLPAADGMTIALLVAAGLVTAVPLMLYANGAKGLRLSTIAVMQYLTPSLVFLVAVLVFGEPFVGARLVAFPLIWAAMLLYASSYLRRG